MHLKFIIICDEFGRKSDPILHYWDEEYKVWEEITLVEVKECNYEAEKQISPMDI